MAQDIYDKLVDYILTNQNKFYRLAYSYVKNQDDALDVVQNAVCKALEKCDTLRNENAMKTWFYRIVVNESITLLNNKKRIVLSEEEVFKQAGYEEPAYEPKEDLQEQIKQLELATQTIIKLRFFEELSLEEIAEIMEMNLSTVKSKLYRGLEKLKIIFKEEEL